MHDLSTSTAVIADVTLQCGLTCTRSLKRVTHPVFDARRHCMDKNMLSAALSDTVGVTSSWRGSSALGTYCAPQRLQFRAKGLGAVSFVLGLSDLERSF